MGTVQPTTLRLCRECIDLASASSREACPFRDGHRRPLRIHTPSEDVGSASTRPGADANRLCLLSTSTLGRNTDSPHSDRATPRQLSTALVPQPTDHRTNLDLVIDVKKCRRLVEEQDLGLLSQGSGNHYSLPFAAGQIRDTNRSARWQTSMVVIACCAHGAIIPAVPPKPQSQRDRRR